MTLDKILRGSSGFQEGIWYPDRGRIPASMHQGRESNYEPIQTRASDKKPASEKALKIFHSTSKLLRAL
jgi:hypothetical protein